MNQSDLIKYLKRKRKYMSVKEIARDTKSTIVSVNRKIKALTPKIIIKKTKKVKFKNCVKKVNFYKAR